MDQRFWVGKEQLRSSTACIVLSLTIHFLYKGFTKIGVVSVFVSCREGLLLHGLRFSIKKRSRRLGVAVSVSLVM